MIACSFAVGPPPFRSVRKSQNRGPYQTFVQFWRVGGPVGPLLGNCQLTFGLTESYSVQPHLLLAATISPVGQSRVLFF